MARRRRLRLTRTHRMVIVACVLIAAFAGALAWWSGGQPARHHVSGLNLGGPSSSLGAPGATDPSGSASGSSTPSSPPGGSGLPDLLNRSFPADSSNADPGGLPRRSVRIVVTSDNVIGGLGYLIAHGDPPRYQGKFLKSPVTVTTTGRSATLVAFVAAQASPGSTFITCELTVDGVLKARHTVHGAYKITTCLG
jgi:hypothetical protein